MKKIFCIILSIVLILSVFTLPSFASFNSLLETEADIVLLVNTDTNYIVFDKNADKKNAPAALTQMVTAILVLENCPDLSKKITCKSDTVNGLYSRGGVTIAITGGESLTVDELLRCMLIHSASDAANILADYVGGGIPNFVKMMNEFAEKLGCTNTHFVNAHGLDEESSYTTANDIYKIASYCLKNEIFKDICSRARDEVSPTSRGERRYLNNTNKLLIRGMSDYYCPSVTGVKAGASEKAGRCVVSVASKNGYNYMLIILGAPLRDVDDDGVEENVAFTESRKIYNWAFQNIVLTPVTTTTDIVTVVDVKYSFRTDHLALVPKEELTALVPSGTDAGSLEIKAIEKETPKTVNAPVKKGDVLGKAQVLYGEDVVATVDLVASESVSGSLILRVTGFIGYLLHTTVVKILLCLVLLLLLAYIALIVRKNMIKAKRKKPRRIK